MPIKPGQALLHYRLVDKIGRGGMGEVWKAVDTTLDREVAIKVLPEEFVDDAERLARFEREAKLLASLNHANIAVIHGLHEAEGVRFLAMELVPGEDLSQRLEAGPLSLAEALQTALAIARALEAAHEKGVVHRDLKPANIRLTPRGDVKVLDFGLAKELPRASLSIEADAVTKSYDPTQLGVVLGTAGYMSPEQSRGQAVDARTDIWALGCVLYEMLAGARPFGGTSMSDRIASVLTADPDWSALPASTPAGLSDLVRRCLEKDRDSRMADIATARRGLETALAGLETRSQVPSIAVLPFVNMSADPEQEYFCDGMAEEIINALAQVSDLSVVARTSAFSFKGKNADIRAVGQALNVQTVLEGSVRKVGDQLRITAQLIDVTDGYHLWSERYDRVLEDVFAIQDEISVAIVEKLKGELLGSAPAGLVQQPTENIEAYQHYLRGRFHRHKWNPVSLQEAAGCYRRATELDPEFALAYLGLAEVYVGMTGIGGMDILPTREAHPLACDAVRQALALNDGLLEAQCVERIIRGALEFDWTGADRVFDQLVPQISKVADSPYWIVLYYLFAERFEDALTLIQRMRESDPLSPLYQYLTGFALFFAGRFDESIDAHRHLLAMEPDNYMGNLLLGAVFERVGRYAEALERYQRLLDLFGREPMVLDQLARLYGVWGKHEEAHGLVEELEAIAKKRHVSPAHFIWTSLALGERQGALAHLERAYEERDSVLPFVFIWPWPQVAEFRSEARVRAIREEMGLKT